ncbi:2489_t:CDS:2 [Entrophospora sp. SA101]|nr:2017_t:CDS:2 [Entrophospora sp. SA101]CAJ0830944.1 2489_t:CDS:2 [Entrophospora sp. SA101]CAJ0881494.1 15876_t:CDS:2 [Entrophospora sp. SA101]
MTDYKVIFQPFIDLFNQGHVQAVLLAWLPTKMGPYLSGVMAVDMFLTTIIASGITTIFAALYLIVVRITTGNCWNKNIVKVQIEHYVAGIYGDQQTSMFYVAISWIISQQTKQLSNGSFLVQSVNSITKVDPEDDCEPPGFNILPEKNQVISIDYKGRKFNVTYSMPETDAENREVSNNSNVGYNSSSIKPMPSIFLTTVEDSNTSVDAVSDFLNDVTRSYLESQKKLRVRSRYERSEGYWSRVQALSSNRGLKTVALEKAQKSLIKRELETFTSDKDFYQKIGMPYRRGILLYGKPGTGKTSLINAISSYLNRDIYFLNLKNICDDNELNAAFSSLPANQIIVLEDVDTHSKILHKRELETRCGMFQNKIEETKTDTGRKVSSRFSCFSLSTFLGCLDGHLMSEGNIIIMTTNHVEVLDPACIRPGRMDVHLDLGYCTHYQIRKMYKNITENPNAEFPQEFLDKIPEKLLPPCEVMMTMLLYRKEIDILPEKVFDLTRKYQDMKPEEIAKLMEDELKRTKKESASNDNLDDEAKEEPVESTTASGDDDGDRKLKAKDDNDKIIDDAIESKEAKKDDSKNEEGIIGKKETKQIASIEMIRDLSNVTWTSDDSDSSTDVEVK